MYLNQLAEGQMIRVKRPFRTYDQEWIEAGRLLTFVTHSYFPYDDGYTFQFREGRIRLSGNDP